MQDSGKKKALKVVHIPFSARNPYQRLLAGNLRDCGINVMGMPVKRFKNIAFLNLSLFALLFKYWKPNIVHLHWQSSFLHVKGSRYKTILIAWLFMLQLIVLKLLNIKLVWTAHNLRRHEGGFEDIEMRYTRYLAKMSDAVIVHCNSAKHEIERALRIKRPEKVNVISHGHFRDPYPNNIERSLAEKKIGFKTSKPTFLFLGEIRYYKGIIELIDAYEDLNDHHSRLLVAGRPHDQVIENEVTQKCKLNKKIICRTGFVPDEELQIYINASDVMVFPYRKIFTSGGIFLALSFGKPIVAPRIGCIKDNLDTKGSFLYNPEDSRGLSNALKTAMRFKEKWETMGRHNLQLAQDLSWDEIAMATSRLYNGIH